MYGLLAVFCIAWPRHQNWQGKANKPAGTDQVVTSSRTHHCLHETNFSLGQPAKRNMYSSISIDPGLSLLSKDSRAPGDPRRHDLLKLLRVSSFHPRILIKLLG